jgi:hypothetical protein
MSNTTKLAPAVAAALSEKSMIDLAKEYAQLGLDAVLSEDAVNRIPWVNSIWALGKIGIGIRDRILVGKILKFFAGLDSVSNEDRREMVKRLEEEPSYGRLVGEHLIELLDSVESHRKPSMVSAVFAAYANRTIDVLMLNRLIYAIEQLPIFQIDKVRLFKESSVRETEASGDSDWISIHALLNAGLADAQTGYGVGIVHRPNATCNAFLALDLDRQPR